MKPLPIPGLSTFRPTIGRRLCLLLLLALLCGPAGPRLLAQEVVVPEEWSGVVVAAAGDWKLVSFVPNRPSSIYPVCQTTYQKSSGEQIRLDVFRPTPSGKAKELYDDDVKSYRKRPKLDRVVVKPRKNTAGAVVGEFAVDYNLDVKDAFFEHAFWYDGDCHCSAQLVIPAEMEKATRDVQLKRFGGLVENFADAYRHP